MRTLMLAAVCAQILSGCATGPDRTAPVQDLVAFLEDAPFELGPADAGNRFAVNVKEGRLHVYKQVFASFDTVLNGVVYSRGELYDALPGLLIEDLPIVEKLKSSSTDQGSLAITFVRPDLPRFRNRFYEIVTKAPAPNAMPQDEDQEAFNRLLTSVRREVPTVDTVYFSQNESGLISGYRTATEMRDSVRSDSLARTTVAAFEAWIGRAKAQELELKDWSSPLPLQIPSVFVDWSMVVPGARRPEIQDGSNVWVGGECIGIRGTDSTHATGLMLKPEDHIDASLNFGCTWMANEDVAEWRRVQPTEIWARITLSVPGRGELFSQVVPIALIRSRAGR